MNNDKAPDRKKQIAELNQSQGIRDAEKPKISADENTTSFNTLIDANETLSALVDSIQDEIWFADTEARIRLANPSALRAFCLKTDAPVSIENLAKNIETYHADGTLRSIPEAPLSRALKGEVIRNEESITRTPATGDLRHRQVSAAPVRDGSGQIIGALAVARDITEQKHAEISLRESENKYRGLFNNMNEMVIISELLYDDHGKPINYRILEANPAYLQRLGRVRDEIVGCMASDVYGLPVPARYLDLFAQVVRKGTPVQFEAYFEPVKRHIMVSAFHLGGTRYATVSTDITKRKRAEEALRQTNVRLERKVKERTAKLAQRATQLRALAGELTITEQRERRRLAKVLHDHLQQLLVGAKFRLTILGRSGDDVLKQAIKEIEDLIDESIRSSRSLTAELSPPILHDAGLNAGLEWLAKRMADTQGLFVDLSAEQVGDLSDDLTIVVFESVRELLFNVVKHSHVRSAYVNLRQIDRSLQLTVSDEGVGFDPTAIQASGDARLGLFGVRERLELFGGNLEILSTPGRGSRLIISIPVIQPTVAEAHFNKVAGSPEEPGAVKMVAPIPGKKIRLLLADDHVVVRQGIANLLGDEPDMEIVGTAANGQEAVELVPKVLPDVILMDMSMPNLNGVEATRIILNNFPGIRIIGLSMFEEAEKAQAMRDAGAVDYLTKSGPAEELIKAIRTSVRASKKALSTKTSR